MDGELQGALHRSLHAECGRSQNGAEEGGGRPQGYGLTGEALRESEARQGKDVAEGATGRIMPQDAKVGSDREAGAGVEVDEVVGGGEGRTWGRHAMDVALNPVRRGVATVRVHGGAAGAGEAGSVQLDGGMHALEDDDGRAMGGERVGEETPSLEMAQVGWAGRSARMLLEDGAERTRRW